MEGNKCVVKCHAKLLIIGLLLTLEGDAVQAIDFHVALSGNDENSGTAEAPFRTPTRARDAVRTLRQIGEVDAGEVTAA